MSAFNGRGVKLVLKTAFRLFHQSTLRPISSAIRYLYKPSRSFPALTKQALLNPLMLSCLVIVVSLGSIRSAVHYFSVAHLAESTPTPSLKPIPTSLLRQDFDLFRKALEEGHAGLYRYTKKPEIDGMFDQVLDAINKPMNVLEFYRLLAPALGRIKCGHTEL